MNEILILDDEMLSCKYVRDLVTEYMPEVKVNACESLDTARAYLKTAPIDLLFLDVEMPGGSGLDILHDSEKRNYEVVFITAHREYAIQAVKLGASDYLLKPLDKREFKLTLEKMAERIRNRSSYNKHCEEYLLNKLTLHYQKGFRVITLKDILYLRADGSYTHIILSNAEVLTISKSLSKFQDRLHPDFFFRIHKSLLINMYHVGEYISDDGGYVVMSNGIKLFISRYRVTEFLAMISRITNNLSL